MDVKVDETVLPGDRVHELCGLKGKDLRKIVLGPGLQRIGDKVVVSRPGILRSPRPSTYYVSGYQKKYIPAEGDDIVGVVATKGGDIFRVDIGASELASLPYLHFENATKKNRPDITAGDTVYARVLNARRNVEVELTCVGRYGKSGVLGKMPEGGFLVHCSINVIRKIRSPLCNLKEELGKYFQFDIAIGINGCIWLHAPSVQQTILIMNLILEAEFLSIDEIKQRCKALTSKGYHAIT